MIADSSASDEAAGPLDRCVAAYNNGIRTRDFSGLLALLTENATFELEGTSERGPVVGKRAIAAYLQDEPPDDPIRVKRWRREGADIVAEFGWTDIPEGGGCLILRLEPAGIASFTIALGGPRCRFR
jgi:hypothetical protein